MKRVVGYKVKTNYKSSLSSGDGIVGKKLEAGKLMLLDDKWIVTVVSQKLLNNFTIVKTKTKEFEVSTRRLSEKN